MTEKTIREDLAVAYRVLGRLGWDDHTYTHLSARSQDQAHFFIMPFGLCFHEVRAENLLKVRMNDAQVIEGEEAFVNATAHPIHAGIYQARADVQAIFHLHTPEIVAVSTFPDGLMPWSQWALHCLETIHYHDYDSLVLSRAQATKLAKDLASAFILLLRHHGSITVGRTIPEAMFFTYHLQMACKTQILLQGKSHILSIPPPLVHRAFNHIISFEENLGDRDFEAFRRWDRQLSLDRQSAHNLFGNYSGAFLE